MTTDAQHGYAEEELTYAINGAFLYVYNHLGYGLLETTYAAALEKVLRRTGHQVGREVAVPVWFEGAIIAHHRLDMLVDGRVIVEIKSTERLSDHAPRQLLNYLRASRIQVGLLLHFGPKPYRRRMFYPSADNASALSGHSGQSQFPKPST